MDSESTVQGPKHSSPNPTTWVPVPILSVSSLIVPTTPWKKNLEFGRRDHSLRWNPADETFRPKEHLTSAGGLVRPSEENATVEIEVLDRSLNLQKRTKKARSKDTIELSDVSLRSLKKRAKKAKSKDSIELSDVSASAELAEAH